VSHQWNFFQGEYPFPRSFKGQTDFQDFAEQMQLMNLEMTLFPHTCRHLKLTFIFPLPVLFESLEHCSVRSGRSASYLQSTENLLQHYLQNVVAAGEMKQIMSKGLLNQDARTTAMAYVAGCGVKTTASYFRTKLPVIKATNDSISLRLSCARWKFWHA
jgi:hypothetical protein